MAQVDPVRSGYLMRDAGGVLHLPALRKLADGFDLVAAGQTNLLAEYTLHNLSDGDFTFSIPAASDAALLIAKLAPLFGYDPVDTARCQSDIKLSTVWVDKSVEIANRSGCHAGADWRRRGCSKKQHARI